jgi:membrane-associated phospholipid phosphatase
METIWNLEISWNIFLQSMGTWLVKPMEAISFLGVEDFLMLLLPALYWCMEITLGLQVAVVLLLSTSVNSALKMAFHGTRPYWFSPEVRGYGIETSFGMPSNHSQMAVAVWGMIAARIRKTWAWAAAGSIVLLIGISRLYLGVHFLHDVLFGWLLGALLLWLVLRFWKPVAAWVKNLSLGRQILAAFLASLVMILIELIPYAWLKVTNWQAPQAWAQYATEAITMSGAFSYAGTLFGMLAGFAWLNHQGGFQTPGVWWKLVLRILLGVAGVFIIRYGLKFIFPEGETFLPLVLRYVRYIAIGAWVSAGAPWTFIRLKLAEKAA